MGIDSESKQTGYPWNLISDNYALGVLLQQPYTCNKEEHDASLKFILLQNKMIIWRTAMKFNAYSKHMIL